MYVYVCVQVNFVIAVIIYYPYLLFIIITAIYF